MGEPLAAARAAAAALQRRREAGGALAIEGSEPEFAFDPRGHVESQGRSEQTESHRLIEHLMIAANERVATLLSEREMPTLYRVHERPEPEAVAACRAARLARRRDAPDARDPGALPGRRHRGRVLGPRRPARAAHGPRPPGAHLADPPHAQAGPLLAHEPRPRRPAGRRATATSPRRSAATPTSSPTARCSARSAPARPRRGRTRSRRRGSGQAPASATR